MKAIVVIEGEGVLALQEVASPTPGPAELLVKVAYAGLNRTDLRRKQLHFSSANATHIAGLEMSGVVVATGPDVKGFSVGDRVMALANGCYAERVVVDYRLVLRVPDGLSLSEAAAIPSTFVTAHNALVTEGLLSPRCNVLVHAASSGVGLSVLQIARALGAQTLIGTSLAPERFERLRELGADLLIDPRAQDVAQATKDATAGHGADIIADTVGAGVLAQNLEAAALGGRIISIGRMGGFTDEIDLDLLALKRLRLTGVTFRSLSNEQKETINQRFLRDVGPLLAAGSVRPLVDTIFPLDAAESAQAYMRSNAHFGKILLAVSET